MINFLFLVSGLFFSSLFTLWLLDKHDQERWSNWGESHPWPDEQKLQAWGAMTQEEFSLDFDRQYRDFAEQYQQVQEEVAAELEKEEEQQTMRNTGE